MYSGQALMRVTLGQVGMWPDRLHNLYFTYLFLQRAINKAERELLTYDYSTGA
jgi:hypothetical protein